MRSILFAAAFVTIAAPALAQDIRPPADDDIAIVVTGNRDIKKTIRQFVDTLTRSPGSRQLARFEQRICPKVFGLREPAAAKVTTRMRLVSAAVTRDVAPAKCVPNVMLVVTRDKAAFMREVARGRDNLFDGLSGSKVRTLVRDPAPVTAWQVLGGSLAADGRAITEEGTTGIQTNRTTEASTRIRPAVRQQFDFAVVVVDAKVIDGLNTTQLADYATMRALASLDPSSLAADAPSILRAIDAPADAEVPLSMTAWDYGFLRGLYKTQTNLYDTQQRTEIAREVEKKVVAAR
ncbi:hypothetical protein [Sphingomonas astaxanthinifaciens]|uniref:Phosphate/phosphite/phosphonate ABC transporter substrate-binding protein n=1 Tax=Sphingomonas astaxanthinifaciens DSM 22298 TaxID=1123267 RepID=A0ABQ5Z239_9SPHN|nr:hypothetical protein [Sphingomonas astaxanthinifaciens]GLR46823.1 hypothetical protein GCM10007925_05340 [Sphingomonas astaxanthinifaciens DSM 22298]